MRAKRFAALAACMIFHLTAEPVAADAEVIKMHVVKSKQIAVSISNRGQITAVRFGPGGVERAVSGRTVLEGCAIKNVDAATLPGGGMKFTKTLSQPKGRHTVTLVEKFFPTATSIRWEIEISGAGKCWTAPIRTQLQYPVTQGVKFWTAWADPRRAIAGRMDKKQLIAAGIVPAAKAGGNWADPLVPVAMGDAKFWYGAPPYRYDKTGIPFCPNWAGGEQVFCMPLAAVLEAGANLGMSLVLSPEDLLLDMSLTTTQTGKITFSRLYHRLGGGGKVRFAMDLVGHEASWRSALGWTARRYKEFFDPPNPKAHQIAGTGAYSKHWGDLDVKKMKAMAFMVNWMASFDFPYMGMFLPPVAGDDVQWRGYGGGTVSITKMREYSRKMRRNGFHVLSYFNVTEFGANVKFPAPARKAKADADLWKDCNGFLYAKLADAIVLTPADEKAHKGFYGHTRPGLPYWTWGRAIVLDPGEPVYQKFLLEQVRRHIELLPDTSGICIDRMDWLRLYNHRRDDGGSWFGGRAVRSLNYSWRDLMSKLGPMVHKAGKVVYCNNHVKRIEQMRHIDGLFDEFTYAGCPLNTVSLLGVGKPVLGWTPNEKVLKPDPDAFFQKYLYLGVFPMCPFPGNDHSLRPSAWVDKQYLDYGRLMILMRGKKWVLEPHVIGVAGGSAKVNLFEVPEGYVIPVVYAGAGPNVKVVLRGKRFLSEKLTVQAVHPGADKPVAVKALKSKDGLILDVPVKRGCAMVQMLRR